MSAADAPAAQSRRSAEDKYLYCGPSQHGKEDGSSQPAQAAQPPTTTTSDEDNKETDIAAAAAAAPAADMPATAATADSTDNMAAAAEAAASDGEASPDIGDEGRTTSITINTQISMVVTPADGPRASTDGSPEDMCDDDHQYEPDIDWDPLPPATCLRRLVVRVCKTSNPKFPLP